MVLINTAILIIKVKIRIVSLDKQSIAIIQLEGLIKNFYSIVQYNHIVGSTGNICLIF